MTNARAMLRRWFAPIHLVDVFVYVVVLNLAIEYVPAVIAETFTMSLFTAIVLKLALEGVIAAKDRIKRGMKTAKTPLGKVLAAVALWLLMVGSKFVVLELIALIFGKSVSLGGFWSVTGLIVVLLLARAGMHRLLGEGVSGDAVLDTSDPEAAELNAAPLDAGDPDAAAKPLPGADAPD